MKQFIGIPQNLNNLIIGKITFKNSILSKNENAIYATSNQVIPSGFKAILTSQSIFPAKDKIVISNVHDINDLHENDIVTIDPNGKINVIFDSCSSHNVIFVTERCNSNCIMCPQPIVNVEDDKFELNLKYISLIDQNTKTIGITGGEPTLIGDKLFAIIEAIHKRIPKASINLLSNGIRFEDLNYAQKFSNIIKQDIVVDIPLYSDIDSVHESIVRTKTFYRTIMGIYNLARFNIKVGLRVVVHKMNYERLPQLAEFIYSNFPFVYHIAFMQMEPIGLAKDNISSLWIDPIDYNIELESAIKKLHHRDMKVSIYNAQLCILPTNIRPFAVQSISDWKRIYIDECKNCSLTSLCPGFFASSKEIHSRGIRAINGLQVN